MKRNLFCLVSFLLTCTCVGVTKPASAHLSTYQESCNNISISGNVLSANCTSLTGQSRRTSIELKGIENINGKLKITDINKPSNYQDSCTNISINGNKLSARCSKLNGRSRRTSIVLNGIENINGILEYTSSPWRWCGTSVVNNLEAIHFLKPLSANDFTKTCVPFAFEQLN